VAGYLRYASYVSKQTYDNLDGWEPFRRQEREAAWPTYADSVLMVSRPQYQRELPCMHVCSPGAEKAALRADGDAFAAAYWQDVQNLQELT